MLGLTRGWVHALVATPVGRALPIIVERAAHEPRVADAVAAWHHDRRVRVNAMLRRAMDAGDLRSDVDLGIAVDLLGGPTFYRRVFVSLDIQDPDYAVRLAREFLRWAGWTGDTATVGWPRDRHRARSRSGARTRRRGPPADAAVDGHGRRGRPPRPLDRVQPSVRRRAQVSDLIRADIVAGRFVGPLPYEWELLDLYGTTRNVLRAALTLLKEQRLITRAPRSGTFGVRPVASVNLARTTDE